LESSQSDHYWGRYEWLQPKWVNLDLFNLSTVFEVSDVGRGNLAISKLLALKNSGPFLQSTHYWMSCSTFLGGGEGATLTPILPTLGHPPPISLCPSVGNITDSLVNFMQSMGQRGG
jgi:hypothetical protein